ncbi:hypothetical protein KJ909_01320 [Patescibacteria group bacterium]|nr:hypothetical protein [Patescibacteria group bacterium]
MPSRAVSVSGFIAPRYFTLDGYTSPSATVHLDTDDLHLSTQANLFGYFQFPRQSISPLSNDLCLFSLDSHSRQSTPTCIPPPPPIRLYTHIGPVLLPPSLTLNSPVISPNSTTFASGQSLPNSPISIYLYQTNDKAKKFPSPVQAFSLPVFSLKSDDQGNFNFTLPTSYSSDYRLFATTVYQDNPSPKSNTLFYSLPSSFNFLYLITIFFIITLSIFLHLLYRYFHPHRYLPAIIYTNL